MWATENLIKINYASREKGKTDLQIKEEETQTVQLSYLTFQRGSKDGWLVIYLKQ
jgi:hypothetical protein